jgi:hypothetical protein
VFTSFTTPKAIYKIRAHICGQQSALFLLVLFVSNQSSLLFFNSLDFFLPEEIFLWTVLLASLLALFRSTWPLCFGFLVLLYDELRELEDRP